MKSGCRSCALAAASSSALGIGRGKITLISTSTWAIPARSPAPIALRYSVSIRAWPHTNPIRQIVLTLTWSEKVGAVLAPCDDVSSAFDQRDQKVKGAGSNWYWFVVIEQKLL